MADNSSNKRIAKNTIFLSVRMVIVLFISFYTTRVVLQILGVVDYGVYNVVCGFVSMFTFLKTSMSNGIQRFFNYEFGKNGEEGSNKVYCTSIYIQIILALIVLILVESIGLWYLNYKMVIPENRLVAAHWIFQFAILTFVIEIMQAPFVAAVTAHERFNFYAVVSVLDAILKLVLVLILKFVLVDKLIVYGFLMSVISFINIVLYFYYCKKNFKEIVFHRAFDSKLFKKMLGFSGWNMFGSLSGVMKEQGINLVLNLFFGPVVNAARGVALQVNSGIQGFVGNILTPVRPQVVQSYAQGDIHRTMKLTYTISKLGSCFFLMMALPASVEIDYVLKLWLGNNIPNYTNIFTILILANTIINILNGAISTIVHATGFMKDYQLWGSLIGISSVPIASILLKMFSLPEIALITVLICSTIGHLVSLFIVRKLVQMPINDYFKKVVLPIMYVFVVTMLIVFPIRFFLSEGLIRLMIVILWSVLTVFISLFYLGMNREERHFLINMLTPIFKKNNKTRSIHG